MRSSGEVPRLRAMGRTGPTGPTALEAAHAQLRGAHNSWGARGLRTVRGLSRVRERSRGSGGFPARPGCGCGQLCRAAFRLRPRP